MNHELITFPISVHPLFFGKPEVISCSFFSSSEHFKQPISELLLTVSHSEDCVELSLPTISVLYSAPHSVL